MDLDYTTAAELAADDLDRLDHLMTLV
jgi:hypothetical protein